METGAIVTALLEKRGEISKAIADLERQVRRHKADAAQIDATIKLFSPSVTLAKREATKFARSAHFVVGELTRRCQEALREADGGSVTADELATRAMREKGLEMGDGALRADIAKRFLWTLNRMLPRGTVVKAGYGADARWALPAS